MKHFYALTVVDGDGNLIVEHDLTADEAVVILATALKKEAGDEEVSTDAEPSRKATPKKGKRGKRKCSNCGEPGHTARTCAADVGTREARETTGRDSDDNARVLTEEEYLEVRAAKDRGESSWIIADELGLPRKQVNIAFSATTYERYTMITNRE